MNDNIEITGSMSNVNPPMGGLLEDNNGGTSSMRILMLFGSILILGIWGFIAIYSVIHGIPAPDMPLMWSGCFTALIAGKVGQKYIEGKQ